jgi:hypothetical protein
MTKRTNKSVAIAFVTAFIASVTVRQTQHGRQTSTTGLLNDGVRDQLVDHFDTTVPSTTTYRWGNVDLVSTPAIKRSGSHVILSTVAMNNSDVEAGIITFTINISEGTFDTPLSANCKAVGRKTVLCDTAVYTQAGQATEPIIIDITSSESTSVTVTADSQLSGDSTDLDPSNNTKTVET